MYVCYFPIRKINSSVKILPFCLKAQTHQTQMQCFKNFFPHQNIFKKPFGIWKERNNLHQGKCIQNRQSTMLSPNTIRFKCRNITVRNSTRRSKRIGNPFSEITHFYMTKLNESPTGILIHKRQRSRLHLTWSTLGKAVKAYLWFKQPAKNFTSLFVHVIQYTSVCL